MKRGRFKFGIICTIKLSEYIGEASSYDKKLMLERDNPVSWLKTASERIGREVTPTFSSDAADFFLTLPNLNYGLSATSGTQKSSARSSAKSSGKSSGKELTKAAKIIVRAIRSNAMVTIPELQKKLLFSDSGIRKVLSTLKREGFIRRVGGRKLGHWELTDKSSRV